MGTTHLRIIPPIILLNCPIDEGYKTQQIGWGARYDCTRKAFKVPFCIETLVMIKRLFKNAEVVEGQEFIEEMKMRTQNNYEGVKAMALAEYPCPNVQYKLSPFKHQLDGLWYLKNFYGGALFAQCGTGKTGITLWDIEAKYQEGLIRPSSVLIVGKLMTLFSGWSSDTLKFTNLTGEVLWDQTRSKDEREKIEIVTDHGPKPKGESTTKRQTEYHHITGGLAILRGQRDFNPKKHVRKIREWKQVGDVKYGQERVVTAARINLRSRDIEEKIVSHEAHIHIINHEGLIIFEKALAARRYDYIAIDESTVIKNPASKIFKALQNISSFTKYRRILSGTPSPQGPQDLWSQFYFLDNGLTLGPDYKEFLSQHFDLIRLGSAEAGTFKGVKPCLSPPNSRNTLGWIRGRLENRVFRCQLRECVDLPPLTTGVLDVFLGDAQRKHYEEMKEQYCTEIRGKEIVATVAVTKLMKLRQITSGFIIDHEGNPLSLVDPNPKIQVLQDYLAELEPGEKVIIFAIYRHEIEMLLKLFGKRAVAIYGGVSDVKKLNAQDQFINNPDVDRIICQPQSAAYGVNGLTVARYLIFYSIDQRSDTVHQAIARIERTGQTRAMCIKFILAKGTIDWAIYRSVGDKNSIQQDTINDLIVRELTGISTT